MDKLASQFIIDIIAESMQVDKDGSDARIFLRNQNIVIPNDDRLFIVVGMVDADVMSASTQYSYESDVMTETQRVRMAENIQIDIFSRNNDALLRKWEVIASLNSIYAKQVQEREGFKIAKVPTSFLNTSETEGAEMINKFSVTIRCLVWYCRDVTINSNDYYNDFDTRVDDAETIGTETGLIEFNITGDQIA